MQAAYPSQRSGKNRRALLVFCVAFWIMIFSVVFSICWMQWRKYTAFTPQLLSVAQEMDREQAKGTRLEEERAYNESDSYVEKVAREHLGLVLPDEILIYDTP